LGGERGFFAADGEVETHSMRSLVKAAHEALYDALEAEVFYKGRHEKVAGEP
jgi:hypothetical protein